jgi:hypothetical protein
LAQRVPEQGICYWPLDCSGWARVHANKSPDRQYIYKPTPLASRGTVAVGYSYSLLDWAPTHKQSWTLSIDVQRVPSTQKEWEVGIEQIRQLNEARQDSEQVLDIVTQDQSGLKLD